MTSAHRGVAALALTVLAACGRAGDSPLPATQGVVGPERASTAAKAKVELRIVVPHRHRRKGAHYISPSTRSLAITIVSSQNATTEHNVDLTPATNPDCTAAGCTIAFSAAPGTYTYALAAYDGLLDANGNPTGNKLSANLNVPVTVRSGRANSVGVTLDGIPAAVALIPAPNALLKGSAQAFALSKCFSQIANQQVQSVTVLGVDADGNFILNAGSPAAALASDDSVHLSVASPSPGTPATFALSDPTAVLPSPNSAVHLTATVTPPAASGGAPVEAVFTVTFDASICGVFTEFPVPTASSQPNAIANGPDGALWFTETAANKIGRITTSGVITEISTSGNPYAIAAGPQNTMWFTQCGSNRVGNVATSGGSVYESVVPTGGAGLFNIASDPHGGFPWFTETLGNNVDTLRESGLGVPLVRETPVPTGSARPWGIGAGPDGAMWFTEQAGNNIGRLSGGAITEFPIPTSGSSPEQIASGSDGNLWFTEGLADKIGRITTAGTIAEFSVPTLTGLEGIAAGPDGALYFAETGAQKIGRITTDGAITEFAIPGGDAPNLIVAGPDGAMWFTAPYDNAIVRMQ